MDRSVPRSVQTRARLLKAATEVFANAGVTGATTREIARVAGVNEVALFRHFQSQEQLLAAVVQQVMALQAEALAHQDEWTQNLYIDLTHYAWLFNSMLEEYEDLIRTFIGEAKRHPEAARHVILEAAQPLREKLITYLRSHQEGSTVRPDLDPKLSVDMFKGMLLSGMLRRSSAVLLGYSCDRYMETCVDLFVRGVNTQPTHCLHPSQLR